MKTRSLAILFLLAGLSTASAVAAVWHRQQLINPPKIPASLFPALSAKVNQVTTIAVITPGDTFTIQKSGKSSWTIPEKDNYPVMFETVKQAVVGMSELKPIAAKTARPELYGKLNLDDPRKGGKGTRIALRDKDAKEFAVLIIGKNKSTATESRVGWHYVRKEGGERAWLAAGRITVWDKSIRWLDGAMPIIERKRIRAVSSIDAKGNTVTVSRKEVHGRDFKLENVPSGRKVVYETAPNALGSALGFMSFDDVRTAKNLDFSKPAHRTVFQLFDGLNITVAMIEEKKQKWWRFTADYDKKRQRLDLVDKDTKKDIKNPEALTKEAETLNKRYGAWAYKLPKYKTDDLLTDIKKITMEDEAAKKSGG